MCYNQFVMRVLAVFLPIRIFCFFHLKSFFFEFVPVLCSVMRLLLTLFNKYVKIQKRGINYENNDRWL